MSDRQQNFMMVIVLVVLVAACAGALIDMSRQKQATPNPTHKIDITTITDSEGNSYIGFIYGDDLEVLPLNN